MAVDAPSPKAPRGAKARPWYLAAALIAASVFGLTAMREGFATVAYHTETRADSGAIFAQHDGAANATEADREAATALIDRELDAHDAQRKRLFPLGVAGMLLGGAIFLVAFRAMAGRMTARNMLLQLVAAQAVLAMASYALTGELRRAEVENAQQALVVHPREGMSDAENEQFVAVNRAMIRVLHPIRLGFHTLASLLILVALTRPRSRAFFEATSDVLHER